MKYFTLARLKKLMALMSLALFLTVSFALPVDAASKSRKSRASRSVKARKGKARVARSRRTRVSRSRSLRASRLRKGRAGRRGRYARGRGRRGRWRTRVASAHSAGVHNYLTKSWTEAHIPGQKAVPTTTGEVTADPALLPVPAMVSVTNPETGEATAELPPLNPLVAAYTDSLALRGFTSDNQGFIVTTMKGEVLGEHNADRLFNPASVTKIATSLTAISRLGPDFRFRTTLYTDGTVDRSTGTLNGSLYVIGSGDPAFFHENALMIVDKLNQSGIREITGNLVVLGRFFYNFSASPEASAKALRVAMTHESWTPAVKKAYPRFLSMKYAEARGNGGTARAASTSTNPGFPSLKINGETVADPSIDTNHLKLLAVHTSLPLVRLLKGLNDYSNNWMASMIGNLVGGPDAVTRFLKTDLGFKDDEVSFATSSGLGANQISPRGTITMLQKLISYLQTKGLGLEDVLPIAGIDGGTLERRFTEAYRGSVVAKTGTLSSVSALAGVAYTRRGPVLFVIYNQGGSAYRFRSVQDETIKKLITLFGGPAPVRYVPTGGPRVSEKASDQAAEHTSSR